MIYEQDNEESVSYWPSVSDLFMTLFVIALVLIAVLQFVLRPAQESAARQVVEGMGGLSVPKVREPLNKMRRALGTQPEIDDKKPVGDVVSALGLTADAVSAEITDTRKAMGPAYGRLTGTANKLRGKLPDARPQPQAATAEDAVRSVESAAEGAAALIDSLKGEINTLKQELEKKKTELEGTLADAALAKKRLVDAEAELNDKPPIIKIKEGDGKIYRFPSGSATLSGAFKSGLDDGAFALLAKEILERNADGKERVDTLEVIGHTDGDPVDRVGNLDTMLPSYLSGMSANVAELVPGSNNDLGLLRALAVRQAWVEFISRHQDREELNRITVRCYSAGQTVPESTALNDPQTYKMANEQFRRIEIRLTKLKDR